LVEVKKLSKVYVSEVNGNFNIDVQEEIRHLQRRMERKDEEEFLEDYYEAKNLLKGFRELMKLPIPTLIVVDLDDEDA